MDFVKNFIRELTAVYVNILFEQKAVKLIKILF